MSQLFVDNIKNRTGGAVGFPTGVVVTGVATFNNQVSIAGTLSYEDVTNVDSTGIITAKSGVKVVGGGVSVTAGGINVTSGGLTIVGGAITFAAGPVVNNGSFIRGLNNSGDPKIIGGYISGSNDLRLGEVLYLTAAGNLGISSSSPSTKLDVAGTVKATSFTGSGANLTGLPAGGVEIESGGSSLGAGVTILNFQSGATVTASGAGSTITISAGVTTTAVSPTANAIHILGIGTAQHHTLTLSAGFSTITVAGGSVGDSHSVVLVQPSSGICTVGLSTFFQFPSGATPVFSEGSSKVDLISFVVKHVGVGGTQLLTSAGLNYS